MPVKIIMLFAATAAALCTACATSNESASSDIRVERVYRTGSNLPSTELSRSGVQSVDPETIRLPTPQPPRGAGN
jgi:hypothetical protein